VRLGFYTNYSEKIVEFAEETGFRSLELSAWPNSSLNADEISDDRIKEICADLERRNLEVSALGYYPNYLDPDKEAAEEARRYFCKVLDLADRMNVRTVCTFAGQIPGAAVEDSLGPFADLFTDFCSRATALGIRIGIENCPMLDYKTRRGENIAYSPEIWDAMFDAVPSSALGLELDPSHMVFLGIDYVQAVLDYGDRIVHVHGKDTDIDERKRSRQGMFGQAIGPIEGFGNGWWRFRAPGFGLIDWPRLISALVDVGYQGNIDIEHEDEVFAKAALAAIGGEADIVEMFGRERNGLVLGYNYLSQLVPPHDGADLLPH
jgi:sugar phosphate isomerase/epimerase